MFIVYILYSASSGKSYTGFTNDLQRRLAEHNATAVKGYTLRYRPWVVIHTETYFTKAEALSREKFYKTGQGRELIKEIIQKYLDDRLWYPPEAEKD